MNQVTTSILCAVVLLSIVIGAISETLHVKRCDQFCGGSRLNPFGASGDCPTCCREKGFSSGGECGDFLTRHCRCHQNPPVYGGGTQQQQG